MKKIARAFFLLFLLPLSAHAGEPRLIGTFGEWSSYVYNDGDSKVCFMSSQPVKSEGKYATRGDVFALVTHRPKDGTKNVFSFVAGYDFKPEAGAKVTIDKDTALLFTQGDTAWAPDAQNDEKIAKLIRSGSSMVIEGTSAKGTSTKDTFSLKGSGAAHDLIDKECGS